MKLPDFLIIGAMKAGTSSLHRYLGQHPDISVSTPKELDFFSRHYDRGLGWYRQQFSGAVSGESSTSYLKAHLWPETVARIRADLPHARLICVLREPVDRALSHYLHNVWRGRESRPFTQAVTPDSNIFMTSRYGWQLDRYLAEFPPERLLLVTTDELDHSPKRVLRRILRFLGVDEKARIRTSKRHNVTATNLAAARATVPPDPVLVAERRRFGLTPAARATLAAQLRPEVDHVRKVWPEFAGWQL
jgi:hypothetical protein